MEPNLAQEPGVEIIWDNDPPLSLLPKKWVLKEGGERIEVGGTTTPSQNARGHTFYEPCNAGPIRILRTIREDDRSKDGNYYLGVDWHVFMRLSPIYNMSMAKPGEEDRDIWWRGVGEQWRNEYRQVQRDLRLMEGGPVFMEGDDTPFHGVGFLKASLTGGILGYMHQDNEDAYPNALRQRMTDVWTTEADYEEDLADFTFDLEIPLTMQTFENGSPNDIHRLDTFLTDLEFYLTQVCRIWKTVKEKNAHQPGKLHRKEERLVVALRFHLCGPGYCDPKYQFAGDTHALLELGTDESEFDEDMANLSEGEQNARILMNETIFAGRTHSVDGMQAIRDLLNAPDTYMTKEQFDAGGGDNADRYALGGNPSGIVVSENSDVLLVLAYLMGGDTEGGFNTPLWRMLKNPEMDLRVEFRAFGAYNPVTGHKPIMDETGYRKLVDIFTRHWANRLLHYIPMQDMTNLLGGDENDISGVLEQAIGVFSRDIDKLWTTNTHRGPNTVAELSGMFTVIEDAYHTGDEEDPEIYSGKLVKVSKMKAIKEEIATSVLGSIQMADVRDMYTLTETAIGTVEGAAEGDYVVEGETVERSRIPGFMGMIDLGIPSALAQLRCKKCGKEVERTV